MAGWYSDWSEDGEASGWLGGDLFGLVEKEDGIVRSGEGTPNCTPDGASGFKVELLSFGLTLVGMDIGWAGARGALEGSCCRTISDRDVTRSHERGAVASGIAR